MTTTTTTAGAMTPNLSDLQALIKDCPNLQWLGMTVLPTSEYAGYKENCRTLYAEDAVKYARLFAEYAANRTAWVPVYQEKQLAILDCYQAKCHALLIGMMSDYCAQRSGV